MDFNKALERSIAASLFPQKKADIAIESAISNVLGTDKVAAWWEYGPREKEIFEVVDLDEFSIDVLLTVEVPKEMFDEFESFMLSAIEDPAKDLRPVFDLKSYSDLVEISADRVFKVVEDIGDSVLVKVKINIFLTGEDLFETTEKMFDISYDSFEYSKDEDGDIIWDLYSSRPVQDFIKNNLVFSMGDIISIDKIKIHFSVGEYMRDVVHT